jgi:hypothetical protein
VLAALCPLLGGCGDSDGPGDVDTSGQCRVSGRLLADEGGAEVSRETLYVHLYADGVGLHKTINPGPGTTFEALMPQGEVRVRVFDADHVYALFEDVVKLAGATQTLELRLKPSNYIRLHGRVLDAATGEPITPSDPDGTAGSTVAFYFQHSGMPLHTGTVSPAADGSYSLKVPRGVITILAVNTAKKLKLDTVDLTGDAGDDRTFDIELLP